MISNPLPPIWTAYKTISDGLRMSHKAVKKAAHFAVLLNGTDFVGKPVTDSYHTIQQSQIELDDLFVLALWATFERCIRDYLQMKGETLKTISPTTLANPLYEHSPYAPPTQFEPQITLITLITLIKPTSAPWRKSA